MKEKLHVPSRLFGRDYEIEIIREKYRQVCDNNNSDANFDSISLFVEGHSGTGKSALVEAALKESVERDQGWYIVGKFDQMRNHRPFSAFMDALDCLCLQAITRKEKAQSAITQVDKREKSDSTHQTKRNRSNRNISNHQMDTSTSIHCGFDEATQQMLHRHEETAIRILLKLVPNLYRILQMEGSRKDGNQADVSENGSQNSSSIRVSENIQSKLRALIIDLLQVISRDKCIVLLIEDLQWGDIDTLDLIFHLVNNVKSTTKFFFVGTFRSEPSVILQDHYLWTQIQHATNKNNNNDPESNPSPQIVSISSLSLSDVTSFVASTLQVENKSKVLPLSKLVHERTKGNILFVHQYLQLLHSNGHIYYSHETFCWKWEDVTTIQDSGPLKESDVIAIIEAKIQKLPPNTIEALQLASCLGGRFDLDIIEFVAQQWWEENPTAKTPVTGDDEGDDIACLLWPAMEMEMLEEVGVASFATASQYKFTHDKIQSAAYDMLGKEEKRKYHLSVGNSLEKLHQNPSGQAWMLILSASNLFKAMDPLTSSQESRIKTATINYHAAVELKANATFESAALMTQNALDLVGRGDDEWKSNYQLLLNIHNLRAEMEFSTGHLDRCEESVSEILKHAKNNSDKYHAYDLKVGTLMGKRLHDEAMDACLMFLRSMEFGHFPAKVTLVHVVVEILRTIRALKGLDDETLLNLPCTEDNDAASFVKTLMIGVVVAHFTGRREEMIFMSMRALRISLKSGYTSYTPTAFAFCGLVHGRLGKLKEAYRFGRIGMELMRRANAPEANLLCRFVNYLFLDHLYNECANYSKYFDEIRRVGISTIHAPMASSAGGMMIGADWYCGTMPLDKLITWGSECLKEQIEHSALTYVPTTRLVLQKSMNLAGRSRDPTILEGDEIKDFSEFMRENSKDSISQVQQWWACLEVATWFGNTKRGEVMAKKIFKLWKQTFPVYNTMWIVFFKGLMWCWLYDETHKKDYKRRARQELKILRGWVKDGLKNRDCFLLFLETEYLALVKRRKSSREIVKEAYDGTLQRINDYGLPNLKALVSERAGRTLMKLFPDDGDEELVNQYLQASVDGYKEWGAWAKVRQLAQEFDFLDAGESRAF